MPPPFRPRTYSDRTIDMTLLQSVREQHPTRRTIFIGDSQPHITFIDDTQAQIDADVRGVTRAMVLGAIAGLIAAALIWWARS